MYIVTNLFRSWNLHHMGHHKSCLPKAGRKISKNTRTEMNYTHKRKKNQ